MNEEVKKDIALFRYGVIAPYIQGQVEEEKPFSYFSKASKKKYEYINGEYITISDSSMYRWYLSYKQKGFDGLLPKARSDVGINRKLDEDIKNTIAFLIDMYPRLPATQIYEKLISNGDINKKDISLSTITRFVSSYKKENKLKPMVEKRRYEREHINEVWCGDSSYGPYITVNGEKKRVIMIGLIDDASRMIVGIDAFFEDNFVNLMSVIKQAVSKFGKVKVCNFDNGSNYKSRQMKLLAARIGSEIHYCHPYSPHEKSKIERFWKSCKDQFCSTIKSSDYHSLDEFREALFSYIHKYNTTVHSSLNGLSPQERFFNESNLIIRMSDEEIERDFLLEEKRKVSADSVIQLNNEFYDVDFHYANQEITIRYSPDLSKIYVVDEYDRSLTEIKLLDKHANSKIKREKVQFSKGEE